MSCPAELHAEIVGRFARDALALGAGEVCATFRRSFYLRLPGERYACIGERALGCGPLNVLLPALVMPAIGQRVAVETGNASLWKPPAVAAAGSPKLEELERAARGRLPAEGLACLVLGEHNAVAMHAQPALESLERWLVGHSLDNEAEILIGLGPGLTPSGDDYLGGMLLALRACARAVQAESLWRWLEPRLEARTSAISAAHLAAAAQGEGHEALHRALACLFADPADWAGALAALDRVGHCSGWDGLAGAVAVARIA
jgi:uncharacterized protein DUF2877